MWILYLKLDIGVFSTRPQDANKAKLVLVDPVLEWYDIPNKSAVNQIMQTNPHAVL